MRLITLLITFIINSFIVGGQTKYNVIKYEHLEFEYRDSLLKMTMFFESHDFNTLVDGFVNRPDSNYSYRLIKKEIYLDTFISKTDNILKLPNYFPTFLISDTLILNHYNHFEFNKGYLPDDNIQYSYILNRLREPIIGDNHDERIIRIIEYPNPGTNNAGIYDTYRFDIVNRKFYYTIGKSNADGDFEILGSYSVDVSDKLYNNFIIALENCDFKNQKYYKEVGLNINHKFFIEYHDHGKCYILQRQLNDKTFRDLYISLYKMRIRWEHIKAPKEDKSWIESVFDLIFY